MRRVKVIKFPKLEEDQRDPDLKDRIALEGAGILNWALEGLARLNARGRFEIPHSVQEATREFQDKNDIPALFLEEVCAKVDLYDPKCRTGAQELYDRYSDWCKRNNHKPMSVAPRFPKSGSGWVSSARALPVHRIGWVWRFLHLDLGVKVP
jgi:putative DNA primase/helicase